MMGSVWSCRFAGAYEGLVSDSVPQVSYAYLSTSYLDDLAYAAAWLYKATGVMPCSPSAWSLPMLYVHTHRHGAHKTQS